MSTDRTSRPRSASEDAALTRLGKNIQIARIEQEPKLPQDRLALEAGVARSHLAAIEAGTHNPSFVTLLHIARALEVEPGKLFAGVDWQALERAPK